MRRLSDGERVAACGPNVPRPPALPGPCAALTGLQLHICNQWKRCVTHSGRRTHILRERGGLRKDFWLPGTTPFPSVPLARFLFFSVRIFRFLSLVWKAACVVWILSLYSFVAPLCSCAWQVWLFTCSESDCEENCAWKGCKCFHASHRLLTRSCSYPVAARVLSWCWRSTGEPSVWAVSGLW